jgi:hypothetical protein
MVIGLTLTAACGTEECAGLAVGEAAICRGAPAGSVATGGLADLQVIGATPVKLVTNRLGQAVWQPACGGGATSLRINFSLLSHARAPSLDGTVDEDRQIRPDDVIDGHRVTLGQTLTASTFSVTTSCLAEHTGSDVPSGCKGVKPSATVASSVGLEFVDHLLGQGRGVPVGVAILIDQSGSTSGMVEGTVPASGLRALCIEGKADQVDPPSDNLSRCASDVGNHRIGAAKALLTSLNTRDRAIVFKFNEPDDVEVVCSPPGISAPTEAFKEAVCFTNHPSFVLGDIAMGGITLSALDGPNGLRGMGSGRSNLWRAVDKAIDYMSAPERDVAARHVIVITDGPDTCSDESVDFQHCLTNEGAQNPATRQTSCKGAVAFGALRVKIEAYVAQRRAAGAENDLHVSFLHFQSPGYPEYDTRMQEVACLTGGEYVYLNTGNIALSDRGAAFDEAVQKLRLSLGGHWGLVVQTDALDAEGGKTYALDGHLYFHGGEQTIDIHNSSAAFGFGSTTDHRLPVQAPCTSNDECGAGAGAGALPCSMRCDPDTRLCNAPAPGSSCGPVTVCCNGACRLGPLCDSGDHRLNCP